MGKWRWTLCKEDGSGDECHSGQQEDLRMAMNDVANTVEYMLEKD